MFLVSLQQYFNNRLKTLADQKAANIIVYPHKFHVSIPILEFIEKYKDLKDGEHLEDVEESLAGEYNLINILL